LREWRKEKGWTQNDLASPLGVSVALVSLWETGEPIAEKHAEALQRLGYAGPLAQLERPESVLNQSDLAREIGALRGYLDAQFQAMYQRLDADKKEQAQGFEVIAALVASNFPESKKKKR
jgi:transcriptional regulator with XRE-family HTH domain